MDFSDKKILFSARQVPLQKQWEICSCFRENLQNLPVGRQELLPKATKRHKKKQ